MNVGIRELKTHLSEYLDKVREGETIVVTDRGKPIALIEPLQGPRLSPEGKRLVDAGIARWGGGPRVIPKPVKMSPGEKTAVDYIREQRR